MLQATTCLPFISPHCEHIDGVGRGLFVDGSFGNYHLNLPSTPDYPVLLLGDGPSADYKQVRRMAADWSDIAHRVVR